MKPLTAILTVIALMLVVYLPKVDAAHRVKTKSKTVTTYHSNGTSVSSSSVSSSGGAVGYYVRTPAYRVSSPRVYYSAPRSQARVYSSCPGGNCPASSYSSSSTRTRTKSYSR